MSMTLEEINFGTFPYDPTADSIQVAFEKVTSNVNLIAEQGAITGSFAFDAGGDLILTTITGTQTLVGFAAVLAANTDFLAALGPALGAYLAANANYPNGTKPSGSGNGVFISGGLVAVNNT